MASTIANDWKLEGDYFEVATVTQFVHVYSCKTLTKDSAMPLLHGT
jgi:hypothetical protein